MLVVVILLMKSIVQLKTIVHRFKCSNQQVTNGEILEAQIPTTHLQQLMERTSSNGPKE
jgi:hypothetical protein